MLSHDDLLSRLHYDPETGIFTYRGGVFGKNQGQVAGTVRPDGYVTIIVRRRPYAASRLAWFYVHGRWPQGDIDHKDRNPGNNRLSNLREATRTQNNFNTRVRADSRTGVKGVSLHRASGLYFASIKLNGRVHSLGYHRTIEDAARARRDGEARIQGEFASCQATL